MTAPAVILERARVVRSREREASTGPSPLPFADLTTLRSEAQVALADGWTPMEAARLVLSRFSPDAAATERLCEMGLAASVNTDLQTRREGHVRPPAAVAILPAIEDADDPLEVPAQKADGTMAPLRAWGVEDWRAWTTYCEAQAEGWFRRQEGSHEIADLLAKQKADTVADLPAAGQEKARAIIRGFRA